MTRVSKRVQSQDEKPKRARVEQPNYQEVEVEGICGIQFNSERRHVEYLVKWVDYDEPSWEVEENVSNCLTKTWKDLRTELLKTFENVYK